MRCTARARWRRTSIAAWWTSTRSWGTGSCSCAGRCRNPRSRTGTRSRTASPGASRSRKPGWSDMTLVAGPRMTGPRPFADYVGLDADTIRDRTWAAKRRLGTSCVILGQHYQREAIIEFAAFRGDSYTRSQLAAEQREAIYIVFCGVHFMAESADGLARPHQTVVLPDLKAGCSRADMATLDDVEDAWDQLLAEHGDTFTPITYMNSSAAIKAFCGARGGVVCRSSNAREALAWAWARKPRVLFLPDQHLGRNPAYRMGVPLEHMAEWIWRAPKPRVVNAPAFEPDTRLVLWRGFCSVHTKFTRALVDEVRAE